MSSDWDYDTNELLNGTNVTSHINNTEGNFSLTDYDLMYLEYADVSNVDHMFSIAVPVLFSLVAITGWIGNVIVTVVVSANRQMRNTTNILIANLAIADLLFITFCVPSSAIEYALAEWPFGNIWCKLNQYLLHVSVYVSIYTLVLMSVVRFMAVVKPLASTSVQSERTAYVAIGILWSVIIIVLIPVYIAHGAYTHHLGDEENTTFSTCLFLEDEGHDLKKFRISFFLTSYVIPLGAICVLYLLMLYRLWQGVNPGHKTAEKKQIKQRITRLILVVIMVFVACWTPLQIILILKATGQFEFSITSIVIQPLAQMLAYFNSCVNPILYAFLSNNFRSAFRQLMPCCAKNVGQQSRNQEKESQDPEFTSDTQINSGIKVIRFDT